MGPRREEAAARRGSARPVEEAAGEVRRGSARPEEAEEAGARPGASHPAGGEAAAGERLEASHPEGEEEEEEAAVRLEVSHLEEEEEAAGERQEAARPEGVAAAEVLPAAGLQAAAAAGGVLRGASHRAEEAEVPVPAHLPAPSVSRVIPHPPNPRVAVRCF